MLLSSSARRTTRELFHSIYCSRPFGKNVVELPPIGDWKSQFPSTVAARSRVFVHNQKTAYRLAKSFLDADFDDPSLHGSKDEGKVVIEAFPGPGILTSALLKFPKSVIKKLIVLEDLPVYLKYLKELASYDERLVVLPMNGYEWSSYRQLEEDGHLAAALTQDWTSENTKLQFICHLPHSGIGEQLIAQFMRCISSRNWLYKYGRIKMNMVLSEWVWQRISAPPGSQARCKLSVIAEANAKFKECIPRSCLAPYHSHFWPWPSAQAVSRRTENRRVGHPMVAASFLPKANPVIDEGSLSKWDYILRKLFVLKAKPLIRALPTLAPGASNLLPVISDDAAVDSYVDSGKHVRNLTVEEWQRIYKAFDEWPFAPNMLHISEKL